MAKYVRAKTPGAHVSFERSLAGVCGASGEPLLALCGAPSRNLQTGWKPDSLLIRNSWSSLRSANQICLLPRQRRMHTPLRRRLGRKEAVFNIKAAAWWLNSVPVRSHVWVVFIPAIIFSTRGTKTIEALLGQHNKSKLDFTFCVIRFYGLFFGLIMFPLFTS